MTTSDEVLIKALRQIVDSEKLVRDLCLSESDADPRTMLIAAYRGCVRQARAALAAYVLEKDDNE